MRVFVLIGRNLLRHKLRSALTVLGIAVAVMAFALLRTVISAWYIGADATSPNRLVTRHAVSFIFPLPLSYKERILGIPGVTNLTWACWFQGVYIDEKNFFPRIACDPKTMLEVYSEYVVPEDQKQAFLQHRNACILGRKTAEKYNLKIGDAMTVRGDIYPGEYTFVVKGIYRGTIPAADETQMFFHFEYLDEVMKRDQPPRAGMVGWYIVQIANPDASADISQQIDAMFKNSPAETKTETEKAFIQGFISMSSAIILAMQSISYIIIGIILLVLANTMVMTARERIVEYAVLKTLGFTGYHIVGLILGESLLIATLGAGLGMALTYPIIAGIAVELSSFFPVFAIDLGTLLLAGSFALLVGILASLVPIQRALKTSIVEGLRHIG